MSVTDWRATYRWYVLGMFGSLASAKLSRDEEIAFVTRLSEVESYLREALPIV